MRKIVFIAIIALTCLQGEKLLAQEGPKDGPNFAKLDASPLDMVVFKPKESEAIARVIYSRPHKRDREVFGKLVPYGEVWRTGANEATELTLYQDMKIAGADVKAGTYTLYTIPEKNEWTVILNRRVHTWGAYEYSDKMDVVRVKTPVKQSPTTIENFSVAFTPAEGGMNLVMGWDDSYVEVPFKRAAKKAENKTK